MLHHCHGVDLLQQKTSQLWIFYHFFLGYALYGEASRGGGGFGGEEDVAEAALAQPADRVISICI